MKKLETIILTETWNDLLGAINKTRLSLQNNTIIIDVATKLFGSLIQYISNARNNFDQYKSATKEIKPNSDYKDKLQRKEFAAYVLLDGKEKFYVEMFLPIIDTLNTHLKQRSESNKKINERFSFLTQLQTIEPDRLKKKCKELSTIKFKTSKNVEHTKTVSTSSQPI
jgi:hypothetical protein